MSEEQSLAAEEKQDKEDKRLSVRVSASEKEAWETLARAEGKTLSNFIRDGVEASRRERSRPPTQPKPRLVYKPVNPDLLVALARIGNNLNQLARHANETGSLPHLKALLDLERAVLSLKRAYVRAGDDR